MITNQKGLFDLDNSVTYLNGAYISPQLKSVTKIGLDQLTQKSKPNEIGLKDFFDPRVDLKMKFADLIGVSNYESIAIIPSVSYGIASVANNIIINSEDEILVCEAQFPSHIYSWQRLANSKGGKVVVIKSPPIGDNRAASWNENILNAINSKTKVVALPHVHWADGTLFDLIAIRKRSRDVGAKLIIDGTQSVGAMPFSVKDIQPDALICAGYKWLMGPYSLGVAYYAESFWNGEPIEHNWINRHKSEDFSKLTVYQPEYQPGAERFSVGESSNFILTPMLTKAIEQIMEWGPENIQEYCGGIITSSLDTLRSKGCFIESAAGRGNHLFGVYLSNSLDVNKIKLRLQEKNIIVSYRGDAIRVSPNVYNDKADFERFVSCFF